MLRPERQRIPAHPYIRRQRKLAIKAAAKTILSYGVAALAFYLGNRYSPRTTSWISGTMWAFFGLIVVLSIVLSVQSGIALSRARKRFAIGHCPTCGYDRTGLAPEDSCPECGSPNKVIDPDEPKREPPAPPKGRPVCARCGGDMTAREARICPDCGAYYGIDYFEE